MEGLPKLYRKKNQRFTLNKRGDRIERELKKLEKK
jgi:hypothetical protein